MADPDQTSMAADGDASEKLMKITYQLYGRCFWHDDCEKSRQGVMKPIKREEKSSLVECGHCGKSGYYPVGGVGTICVKEIAPPAASTEEEKCGNCGLTVEEHHRSGADSFACSSHTGERERFLAARPASPPERARELKWDCRWCGNDLATIKNESGVVVDAWCDKSYCQLKGLPVLSARVPQFAALESQTQRQEVERLRELISKPEIFDLGNGHFIDKYGDKYQSSKFLQDGKVGWKSEMYDDILDAFAALTADKRSDER